MALSEQERARLLSLALHAILHDDDVSSSLVIACAKHLLEKDGDMPIADWLTLCAAVYGEVTGLPASAPCEVCGMQEQHKLGCPRRGYMEPPT